MLKESGGFSTNAYSKYFKPNGGSASVVGSGTAYTQVNYMKTVGFNTPNFHSRLARGELLPFTSFNQFSLIGFGESLYDITDPSGNRTWYSPNAGPVQSYIDVPEQELTDLMTGETQQYVQQAAAKIYNSSFDALTFLAELHKTIAMFSAIGQKLLRMLNSKPPDVPWNLWLEGRYGWRILVYELEALRKACAGLNSERKRFSERCGSVQYWSSSTVSGPTSNGHVLITDSLTKDYKLSLRGSVVADIEIPNFSFNPVLTAWELLKFSFVIDWFIGVGQALSALSFLTFTTNYAAAGGMRLDCTLTHTTTVSPLPGFIINQFRRSAETKAYLISRVPTSVSSIPQLKVKLNVSKIIDLLALLAQALLRR